MVFGRTVQPSFSLSFLGVLLLVLLPFLGRSASLEITLQLYSHNFSLATTFEKPNLQMPHVMNCPPKTLLVLHSIPLL